MEMSVARAEVARLQEIRDEAALLLANLRTLQEEAKTIARGLLPPKVLSADSRGYAGAYQAPANGELSVVPCGPGERAGLTRALLGLAQAEPLGHQFVEQLGRISCVLGCATDTCYRSA